MVEQDNPNRSGFSITIRVYNPEIVGIGIGMAVSAITRKPVDADSFGIGFTAGGVAIGAFAIDIKNYFLRRSRNSDIIDDDSILLDEIDNLNEYRSFMRPSDQESD